jgi:hypothetical protein
VSFGVAYVLDGATHNNPYDNLNLPLPFPDALQEFYVATSGLSAQSGMHSGASVNAVTKSGTNRYSGNLFEFVRDNAIAIVEEKPLTLEDGVTVTFHAMDASQQYGRGDYWLIPARVADDQSSMRRERIFPIITTLIDADADLH